MLHSDARGVADEGEAAAALAARLTRSEAALAVVRQLSDIACGLSALWLELDSAPEQAAKRCAVLKHALSELPAGAEGSSLDLPRVYATVRRKLRRARAATSSRLEAAWAAGFTLSVDDGARFAVTLPATRAQAVADGLAALDLLNARLTALSRSLLDELLLPLLQRRGASMQLHGDDEDVDGDGQRLEIELLLPADGSSEDEEGDAAADDGLPRRLRQLESALVNLAGRLPPELRQQLGCALLHGGSGLLAAVQARLQQGLASKSVSGRAALLGHDGALTVALHLESRLLASGLGDAAVADGAAPPLSAWAEALDDHWAAAKRAAILGEARQLLCGASSAVEVGVADDGSDGEDMTAAAVGRASLPAIISLRTKNCCVLVGRTLADAAETRAAGDASGEMVLTATARDVLELARALLPGVTDEPMLLHNDLLYLADTCLRLPGAVDLLALFRREAKAVFMDAVSDAQRSLQRRLRALALSDISSHARLAAAEATCLAAVAELAELATAWQRLLPASRAREALALLVGDMQKLLIAHVCALEHISAEDATQLGSLLRTIADRCEPLFPVAVPAVAAADGSGGGGGGGGAGGGGGGGAGGAGGAGLPDVTLHGEDHGSRFIISHHGLRAAGSSWDDGGRGNIAVRRGSVFFEVTCLSDGIPRVGWSALSAGFNLGTDARGWGFGGTAKKAHDGNFVPYGTAFGRGDVIGCYLSLTDEGGSISWAVNGEWQGEAYELPEAFSIPLYPAIVLKEAKVSVNFGASPMAFPHVLDGYTPLQQLHPSAAVLPTGGVVHVGAGRTPLALILEPSRDLAEQALNAIDSMGAYLRAPKLRSVLLVGGLSPKKQLAALAAGVDIAVGTPGRVLDWLNRGKLDLSCCRFFVLDEADRLLDPGNQKDIMAIFNELPKSAVGSERLQVAFFSATLHDPMVNKLADVLCNRPTWVDLKGKDAVPETVHHVVVRVPAEPTDSWAEDSLTDGVHARMSVSASSDSRESASERIKRLKPRLLVRLIEALAMEQCLIFCRTNLDCDNLEKYLVRLGGGRRFTGKAESGKENRFSCCVLAGKRRQEERQRNLAAFRDGDVRFLISTDVGARGLDIDGLPFVVNMTLPAEESDYLHRIGRVGRAGRLGLAISLVATAEEQVWYHVCRSKGRGCHNTKTCTRWYNEPAKVAALAKRLGMDSIPEMGAGFTLPEGMQLDAYGEDAKEEVDELSEHMVGIQPRVARLAALEEQTSSTFLSMKLRFGDGGRRAGSKSPAAGTTVAGEPPRKRTKNKKRRGGRGGKKGKAAAGSG
eukprot:PLAT12262.2.p1 GENE.PLAT12262.2~~PLAT12262.2.p1  ORF type:complete len:1365 (+),score=723.24 PLAT12262.2:227-4096(+)